MTGDVTVEAGARLTIEPGVMVKFEAVSGCNGQGRRRLSAHGRLMAQGTSGSPIVFNSSRDDGHGGDSNGDGTATVASPDDWGFVHIMATGSVLEYCERIVALWLAGEVYRRLEGATTVPTKYPVLKAERRAR